MVKENGKTAQGQEQQAVPLGAKAEEAIGKGAYAVGKRIGDLGRAFKGFKEEFEEALHEGDEKGE